MKHHTLPTTYYLLLTTYNLQLTSTSLFTICNLSKLSHPLSNVKHHDHCPFAYETKISNYDYKPSKRKNKKIKKCPTQSHFRKCLLTIRK